jgi:hypothetical protein
MASSIAPIAKAPSDAIAIRNSSSKTLPRAMFLAAEKSTSRPARRYAVAKTSVDATGSQAAAPGRFAAACAKNPPIAIAAAAASVAISRFVPRERPAGSSAGAGLKASTRACSCTEQEAQQAVSGTVSSYECVSGE